MPNTRSGDAKFDEEEPAWATNFKAEMREMVENAIKASLPAINNSISNLQIKTDIIQGQNVQQSVAINELQRENMELKDRLLKLECRSMRENIIVSGLPEVNEETETTLTDTVASLFEHDMAMRDKIPILKCHRLRKSKNDKQPRNVIARLGSADDVARVLGHAKNLAGHQPPVYINQQYPPEITSRRRILLPAYQEARRLNMKAALNLDKLYIKGNLYTVDNMADVPFDLSKLHTKENEEAIAFFGKLSPLSNFHQSKFTVDGNMFNCVEQYYQLQKVRAAKKVDLAAKITNAKDPAVMKKAGDSVSMTHVDDWQPLRDMKIAAKAKFEQNDHLRQFLLNTGEKRIAEASKNHFWGCGMTIKDPNILHTPYWNGHNTKNNMGKILEEIRKELED